MAQEGHWVYRICNQCMGHGHLNKISSTEGGGTTEETEECPACHGDKVYLWGYMTKDNYTLPDVIPEGN
mgnify:CR=1 FL=1